MISQFLILLSFVLKAFAQQETTQAVAETTTVKDKGLSETYLFYSSSMSHRTWVIDCES